ncbi:MAG: magnesium chelatase [Candidatus Doudnabacteria bacterium RIFCSPLOWO2_02_FULL_42_9]|uniref:Magnesium chelatase n=1 Tax=Candidatus Doudnabacteria bacterium RIFCSPHIGHO2_01_FULL_41_86 TaxID=1817821 RepID=A0A1F5N8S5_9BACT|nr:MAG: magnesium chelatase [Candidatus Doudnabacteria bacterium RIFCSPHIGHO2_01_FULL_41_86]OGE75151.1 MAG: magnesium chelatase [Candidatus Doudnabacteria bacterium RIFCSPHIGHO2_01_43_10]OGE86424.1 MAG: magnesium chelatase [Candidatus Doudnabacteria bacterium RIFCSPHIGHO2_12_FULL_42_22]OGE87423.1 MAG: magnesium chelatase [Candidatus Doudnabacteria bacterium RIFCSPHIGHO2_02_FULL_42_25]OGE92721.1 MAG: magnesium chelatase [Candidatus Doudnabacteria bacterium RIFCSPLOWO2_01_FULL_42_60]OGE94345.1 M
MPAKVYATALVGLDAAPIEVEVDISGGLPKTIIVGLPDTAVQEAKERVKSAIKNSNAIFPRSHVAINLAPADLPKNGTHYDLPIALSILLNSGQIFFEPKDKIFLGELALDGSVRAVSGVLSMLLSAKEQGFKKVFVPKENSREASLVSGITIIPIKNLYEVIGYLQNLIKIKPIQAIDWEEILSTPKEIFDLKLIKGQESAKRALEIAASGGHNVLLSGPPGTGKTLLAKALPSILPKPTVDEVLEITKIYSVAGLLNLNKTMITMRPFRSPHHSSSSVALVGGGSNPKPGEISLAHRGVLFMDEFPEFNRSVLENLRQPLEDGVVTVARAAATVEFPAQFTLVAAQNPCPCGYFSDPTKPCICSPSQIAKYHKKISGPMMDRIDLHVEVGRIEYDKLASDAGGESSEEVQSRVQRARDIQTKRFSNLPGLKTNSEMTIKEIKEFCQLGEAEQAFMKAVVVKMYLSARSYHRVLKLARTIADLEDAQSITVTHLAEAVQYRPKVE